MKSGEQISSTDRAIDRCIEGDVNEVDGAAPIKTPHQADLLDAERTAAIEPDCDCLLHLANMVRRCAIESRTPVVRTSPPPCRHAAATNRRSWLSRFDLRARITKAARDGQNRASRPAPCIGRVACRGSRRPVSGFRRDACADCSQSRCDRGAGESRAQARSSRSAAGSAAGTRQWPGSGEYGFLPWSGRNRAGRLARR